MCLTLHQADGKLTSVTALTVQAKKWERIINRVY